MIRKKSELKPEIRIGMKGGPGQNSGAPARLTALIILK